MKYRINIYISVRAGISISMVLVSVGLASLTQLLINNSFGYERRTDGLHPSTDPARSQAVPRAKSG